jgi:hypothetical protein
VSKFIKTEIACHQLSSILIRKKDALAHEKKERVNKIAHKVKDTKKI